MPWQQYVSNVAGEIDPDTGLLVYNEVVLVVMRQQGKTELMLPQMTHRCTGYGAGQRVLYTTQTADKAREKWRDIHVKRLEESPLASEFAVRYQRNFEAMTWANGSMWSPGSTTGKTGGTGDTLDMGVIDEAWSRPDSRTELGMRPAMLTRDNKQLWVVSMVPGLSRALPTEWPYLKAKMMGGRARVEAGVNEGVAYFEFSAEEGLDPKDPATWWSCMPAMGYTITEHSVRADAQGLGMDAVDFNAEYLGWIPTVLTRLWQVIPQAEWNVRLDPQSCPGDPVAFGVCCTTDRGVATIMSASVRGDGDLHWEIVDRRPGVEWAVDRLMELLDSWAPCAIGIDPNGPASSLILPLRNRMLEVGNATRLLTPNLKEYAAACARAHDAMGGVDEAVAAAMGVAAGDDAKPLRKVYHLGQTELDTSIAGAAKRTFGGQWVWERDGVPDPSPVNAGTLATWAGEELDWLGGGYDIASSLG